MPDDAEVVLPAGQPREDLDTLYKAALRVAMEAVTKGSAFPPFGMVVKRDGGLSGVKAQLTPEGPRPSVDDVVAEIRAGLRRRAQAGEIRASVIAIDISMRHPEGGPGDGAKLEFEHREADPLTLVVPYVPDADDQGRPSLAPAFAVEPTPIVFVA